MLKFQKNGKVIAEFADNGDVKIHEGFVMKDTGEQVTNKIKEEKDGEQNGKDD